MLGWKTIKKMAAAGWARAVKAGARAGCEDRADPGAVTVTQRGGVRYLSLGTEWIQGAMRLARPDEIELEYARRMMGWMLFEGDPSLIVQMGLGGGALAKFCLLHFPQAAVEVVEIDERVAQACHAWFALPTPGGRFRLVIGDARDYALDPARHGRASVLQVDVYDAHADGPAVGSPEFYQGCFDCLAPGGWMCVNLFGDHGGFMGHLGDIRRVFGRALLLGAAGEGNVVAMARKGPIELDWPDIEASARAIELRVGMRAASWVSHLRSQG